MHIVERVTALRQVSLFAGTPGRILAALGEVATETRVRANETIIVTGAIETTLFVVVEGELVAEIGDRTIATLGPGSVVGELAVFVPQPRSATVRTLTDCVLLTLEKEVIDELLMDYPEVAISIIRELTRRIQLRNRTLDEAGH